MLKKGLNKSEQKALHKLFMKQTPPKQAAKQMRVVLDCVLNFYAAFADPNISKLKQAKSEKIHQQNIVKEQKKRKAIVDLENEEADAKLNTANANVAVAEKNIAGAGTAGAGIAEVKTTEVNKSKEIAPVPDNDPWPGSPEWDALPPAEKGAITRRRNTAGTSGDNPLLK